MISDKMKKKVLAFHGLDPEKHSDDDAQKALDNAVTEDDLDALNNRARAAEEALIEQDLETFKNRIGDKKDFWKKALLDNRAEARAALEAMPEPVTKEGKKPIHNRSEAGTPEALDKDAKATEAQEKRARAITNRTRELRAQNPRLTHRQAHDMAKNDVGGA